MTTYTEHLKLRKPAIGQSSWGDEMHDNIEIQDFITGGFKAGNVVLSGCAPSDGGGLDVDYAGGEVSVSGTRHTITGGSKTCTANVKNWLCVDASGVVQLYTTAPTAAYCALAMIDAGTAAIDRFADCRKLAEGAAAFDLDYTPDNYTPDTGESKEIEQHLAGVDTQLGLMGGFKNLLINPAMQISQRGSSFTGLGNGDQQYTLDRWRWAEGGTPTAIVDVKQTADHPLTTNGKCLEVDVTTAQASPAASDQVRIQEIIEGQSLQRLLYGGSNAKTMALSFWVKSYQTGLFPVSLNQEDGTYSFVSTYTVNASDTWEYKTVSIPGNTAGGIGNDNTEGLRVTFAHMVGTDYETATLDQWISGGYKSTSGVVNVLDSTSNNWRLADVQLEVGEVATPFEQRDIGGVELALCQRYFEKSYNSDLPLGYVDASGAVSGWKQISSANMFEGLPSWSVRKRTSPTVCFYSPSTGTADRIYNVSATADKTVTGYTNAGETHLMKVTMSSSMAAGDIFQFHWAAEAEL